MTDLATPFPAAHIGTPPGGPTGTPHAAPPAPRDFDIVPRKGLPIVAAVFIVLVVAIAVNRVWPLLFLHVAFGAAWTIIDLYVGFIVGPIIGKLPPPARIEFATRFMPKMVLIMPTVVTVTLAAGWQIGTLFGTVNSSYADHNWIVASYVVVGVMAVIALGLLSPANIAVLTELKKPKPNPAVIQTLMKRFVYASAITGTMQVATLVIMTKIRVG